MLFSENMINFLWLQRVLRGDVVPSTNTATTPDEDYIDIPYFAIYDQIAPFEVNLTFCKEHNAPICSHETLASADWYKDVPSFYPEIHS
jgi:hypothetical protein